MKAKLLIISTLTAVSIFFLSGATWAGSKKSRHHNNSGHKHFNVLKNHNPYHFDNHWKTHHRHHNEKHYYGHHPSHRAQYHHRVIHRHNYHHRPYYRDHIRHRPYYKHHKYNHRLVKKHRPYRQNRPIYRHSDGKVSILASASDHGWSIRISSKDKK